MARGEIAPAQQALIHGIGKSCGWSGEHDLYAMLADIAVRERDLAALRRYAPLAEEHAARYDHHSTWLLHTVLGVYATTWKKNTKKRKSGSSRH